MWLELQNFNAFTEDLVITLGHYHITIVNCYPCILTEPNVLLRKWYWYCSDVLLIFIITCTGGYSILTICSVVLYHISSVTVLFHSTTFIIFSSKINSKIKLYTYCSMPNNYTYLPNTWWRQRTFNLQLVFTNVDITFCIV